MRNNDLHKAFMDLRDLNVKLSNVRGKIFDLIDGNLYLAFVAAESLIASLEGSVHTEYYKEQELEDQREGQR